MPTELTPDETRIRLGGGQKAIDRQHEKGRLTARERIDEAMRSRHSFFELGAVGRHTEHVRGLGRGTERRVS